MPLIEKRRYVVTIVEQCEHNHEIIASNVEEALRIAAKEFDEGNLCADFEDNKITMSVVDGNIKAEMKIE